MARSVLLAAGAVLALLTGCSGMTLLKSSIGGAVPRGHRLTLVCKVDPGGKKIYQSKWYKDGQEFYRHQPGRNPPGKAFPVNGTRVNVAESDDSRVVLEDVDLDTAGKYGCEVTSEYPFTTVTAKGNVIVVEVPERGPSTGTDAVISGDSGDITSINCTSMPSRPATNLTWFINGEQTGSRWTTRYPVTSDESGRQTAVLGLDFRLKEEHFRRGVVTLQCTAGLYDVYYNSAEVKVHRRSMAQRSSQLDRSAGDRAAPAVFPAALLAVSLACILAPKTIVAT